MQHAEGCDQRARRANPMRSQPIAAHPSSAGLVLQLVPVVRSAPANGIALRLRGSQNLQHLLSDDDSVLNLVCSFWKPEPDNAHSKWEVAGPWQVKSMGLRARPMTRPCKGHFTAVTTHTATLYDVEACADSAQCVPAKTGACIKSNLPQCSGHTSPVINELEAAAAAQHRWQS